MLTADQNAALDALASAYQGTPQGVALALLRDELWRLRAIEQAARDYCAINGRDRYNRLIDALNGVKPATYEPIH